MKRFHFREASFLLGLALFQSSDFAGAQKVKGALSKFDYGRKLAAALCYVSLVRLDSIYLQHSSFRRIVPHSVQATISAVPPCINCVRSIASNPVGK
jgi:hypothetical protein